MPELGKLIGEGNEHIVHLSVDDPNTVIKVPTNRTLMWLRLGLWSLDTIRNNIKFSQQAVSGTEIKIPDTEVVPEGKAYYLRQQLIEPARDILEAKNYFDSLKKTHPFINLRFRDHPENFVYSEEGIYYLDLMRSGPLIRALDGLNVDYTDVFFAYVALKRRDPSLIGDIIERRFLR